MARVELLATRPMQCFRCLELGHTRSRCTAEIDRSGLCYRCGQEGHLASACSAASKCLRCEAGGRPADHRMGGKACMARPPKGQGRSKRGASAAAKVVGPPPAGSGMRGEGLPVVAERAVAVDPLPSTSGEGASVPPATEVVGLGEAMETDK